MKRGRLVGHAQRHVRRALVEFHLHLLRNLLLRGEIGSFEPCLAQVLHLRIRRPTEPASLRSTALDGDVRRGRDVPKSAKERIENIPTTLVVRLLAGPPLHHRAPFHRLEIGVHADLLQRIGSHLRFCPDRGDRRCGEDHHLLALVSGGNQILLQLVVILGTAGDFDPDRAGHRRAGNEDADICLDQARISARDRLHHLLLIDRREHDATDRRIIERREQVIEAQTADFARAILDRQGQVLAAL